MAEQSLTKILNENILFFTMSALSRNLERLKKVFWLMDHYGHEIGQTSLPRCCLFKEEIIMLKDIFAVQLQSSRTIVEKFGGEILLISPQLCDFQKN